MYLVFCAPIDRIEKKVVLGTCYRNQKLPLFAFSTLSRSNLLAAIFMFLLQ